jgi:hypothetical protein
VSSELVYRMRTCAAALLGNYGHGNTPFQRMYCDAANLLVEASNLLDVPEPLGDRMEVLPIPDRASERITALPAAIPRPCPACGNVAARKVRVTNTKLLLTCPMCSHEWEYAP